MYLWDLFRPTEPPDAIAVTTLPGPLAFSPAGLWLATSTACRPAPVCLLDLGHPAAACRPVRDSHYALQTLAFSPAGRWLAAGTLDEGLVAWNTTFWEAGSDQFKR